MTRALLLAYLVLLPVAWSPWPWNVQVGDLLLLPLLAGGLALYVPSRLRGLDLAVLTWWIVGLVSSSGGLVSIKELSLVVLYTAVAVLARAHMSTIIRGLVWPATAISLAGLGAVLAFLLWGFELPLGTVTGVPGFGVVYRLYGPFQSAAYLGAYLAVAVPLALSLRGGVLAFHLAVMSLFTYSASILGVAVAIVAAMWSTLPARHAWAMALVAVGVFVHLTLTVAMREGMVYATEPAAFAQAGGTAFGITAKVDVLGYAVLKRQAWDLWRSAPWLGVGLGRFREATGSPWEPHCTLCGRLAETGLLGGLTLITLWIVAVRQARGPWRAALIGLVITSLAADVMHFRFLWVVLGAVRGLGEET